MWRIRLFEERVGQLKRADEVHGLIHLSLGQESVAAGVCAQLRDDDTVYSGHRAHGHAIAKGAPIDRVMAELMGREDGLCHGLGGGAAEHHPFHCREDDLACPHGIRSYMLVARRGRWT